MANFHPEEHVLTAYAAGTLSLSHAVCVAGHLEQCSKCANSVTLLSDVGGDLLESLPGETVSEDLKQSVFDRIDALPDPAPAAPVPERKQANGLPRVLAQFGIEDLDQLDWQKQSGSIATATLATEEDGKTLSLLRISAGGKLSQHTHVGEELTLVLTGSFSDQHGVYAKGDFMLMDEHDDHAPLATADMECICLTVQEGPIQFKGPVMRMLNPYLRYRFRRDVNQQLPAMS